MVREGLSLLPIQRRRYAPVVFPEIITPRLLLRPPGSDDVTALVDRRAHPEVARWQGGSWSRERAEAWVASCGELGGPVDDEWYLVIVVDRATGNSVGDLALHQMDSGHTMEIGYSFHPDHSGRGFATEAVGALVDWLFDHHGVTRITGMLQPENRASAMVLERSGFVYEGHTRKSWWGPGEPVDDLIYGMLREDRDAWRSRPTGPPAEVGLVEVNGGMFDSVFGLRTHHSQQAFVAPMAKSLAQALLAPSDPEEPATPWYRAIVADGVVAGFVMLALPSPTEPEPYLWRLLIDRLHQRRGIAGRALDLVEDQVRVWGHPAIVTSWVPGKGSPEPFYLARGYVPTGAVEEGETVGRKAL